MMHLEFWTVNLFFGSFEKICRHRCFCAKFYRKRESIAHWSQCQDALTDVQRDVLEPPSDLEVRSDFDLELLRLLGEH